MKTRFKLYFLLVINLMSLFISGCKKDAAPPILDNIEEIFELPGFNGEGYIEPVKINNNNYIIGHFTPLGSGPSAGDQYEGKREFGFVIHTNGTNMVTLNQSNHVVTRPRDINEANKIVGEYISETNFIGSANTSIPHAFIINKDGTGFLSIHPNDAYYSSATHITNHPYILGHYSNTEQGSVACLFAEGTVKNLVDTNLILYSRIHAVNSEYAIIYGYDGTEREYFSYNFANETLEQLSISASIADVSEIHSINEQGFLVGYSLDFSISDAYIGLLYDISSHQLIIYKDTNNKQGSNYVGYSFRDIDENNAIIGFAERPFEGGFLQTRAMIIDNNFQGFRDVTPQNTNAYSELVSINNSGIALGYLGIWQTDKVLNKLMIIDTNGL